MTANGTQQTAEKDVIVAAGDREMKAFIAGWFAHARNPDRLVVEDAWRAYGERPPLPGVGPVQRVAESGPIILCGTRGGCTCGAPADTPGGMHHDYCPSNPASRVTSPEKP